MTGRLDEEALDFKAKEPRGGKLESQKMITLFRQSRHVRKSRPARDGRWGEPGGTATQLMRLLPPECMAGSDHARGVNPTNKFHEDYL